MSLQAATIPTRPTHLICDSQCGVNWCKKSCQSYRNCSIVKNLFYKSNLFGLTVSDLMAENDKLNIGSVIARLLEGK